MGLGHVMFLIWCLRADYVAKVKAAIVKVQKADVALNNLMSRARRAFILFGFAPLGPSRPQLQRRLLALPPAPRPKQSQRRLKMKRKRRSPNQRRSHARRSERLAL